MSYSITVKWPSGDVRTVEGFEEDAVEPWSEFLWLVGADDVRVACECGRCETCTDRGAFYDLR